MIIFVVFQWYPISHQKKSVWQSSITKVYLWTLRILIFCTTNHKKFIEFILFPCPFKIILIWINLQLLTSIIILFPFLFLPKPIPISIIAKFLIELFDKFQIFYIISMHFFQSFLGILIILLVISYILHLIECFRKKRQAHTIIEVYKCWNIRLYASNIRFNRIRWQLSKLDLYLFKIFTLCSNVRSLVGAITWLNLISFFRSDCLWRIQLLLCVKWVIWVISHCVVNVSALMVE